jgi:hypothetical protein
MSFEKESTAGEGLGSSGEVWGAMGCSGRPWGALGGSGRLWEALGVSLLSKSMFFQENVMKM